MEFKLKNLFIDTDSIFRFWCLGIIVEKGV